ncbi:MAG: YeeE/YedE family protein [Gemmatimonadetes bacterium]|nr:YeeE/YedE family protein [Gemmatimonadota bacterium]
MSAIFPLTFASDDLRLLTAVAIGGAFGFALERGGFGNARKLAAQFYLSDMTVFKVMFTAILVAMTGVYTLAGLGVVDLAGIWINPTFIWAQLVGGFLLGLGFILSGLCPGTSLVSAASGRLDAVVTVVGIFFGTWLFGATVDWFPGLAALYKAGSLGVSTLPDLLGIPAWVVVLLVVAMAGMAFVGAEKVERIFEQTRGVLALTPSTRPPVKFALTAVLVVFVLVGTAARRAPSPAAAHVATAIEPLSLATRIIERDPSLLVLDLRGDGAAKPIPGALLVAADTSALGVLAEAVPGRTTVVVYDSAGSLRALPGEWPADLEYRYLAGGRAGWEREVLTPATPRASTWQERERVQRQHHVAAFFSGAGVKASSAAPPPRVAGGGGAKKKKGGGC